MVHCRFPNSFARKWHFTSLVSCHGEERHHSYEVCTIVTCEIIHIENVQYYGMTLDKVLTCNWINTEGKEVELVTSTKLLGLTIANDLTWSDHVTEITKKANKRLYFLTQLKRAEVPKQDLALFYVSCVRSVIDYAAPVFSNGLPQYSKKELVPLEKRSISIITSGKCNSAIEVGLTPILEHYYVIFSRLFDNIVSDLNHKLKALLPPDHDISRYNLRRQWLFNMPKLCTNRESNTFIYAMSKQSGL